MPSAIERILSRITAKPHGNNDIQDDQLYLNEGENKIQR
jgi:hypothetical protein